MPRTANQLRMKLADSSSSAILARSGSTAAVWALWMRRPVPRTTFARSADRNSIRCSGASQGKFSRSSPIGLAGFEDSRGNLSSRPILFLKSLNRRHNIADHIVTRRQLYSRYLPVVGKPGFNKGNRKSSVSKEWEARQRDLERIRQMSTETKRRSTMNSRATYDEDEMLRKVLEESKADGALTVNGSETGTTRKGKRGRDDSEE
jgi:hypothetical protein